MPGRPPLPPRHAGGHIPDPRGPRLTLVAELPAHRESSPRLRRGPVSGPGLSGASALPAGPEGATATCGRRLPVGGQLDPAARATVGASTGPAWPEGPGPAGASWPEALLAGLALLAATVGLGLAVLVAALVSG
jgi:hypothetical protein